MRIVHVSDAYLPKQGGIEVQVHDLASRQVESGHDVTVITCASDDRADRVPQRPEEPSRDPVQGQPRVVRLRSPWGRVRRTNKQLHTIMATTQPDVVHAHLSVRSPLSILAVRAAARRRPRRRHRTRCGGRHPLYVIADLITLVPLGGAVTAVSELAPHRCVGVEPRRRQHPVNGIDLRLTSSCSTATRTTSCRHRDVPGCPQTPARPAQGVPAGLTGCRTASGCGWW
jgi:glycosyltransferase involved in cell wall biosynthesis